jgi:hypothetical protein
MTAYPSLAISGVGHEYCRNTRNHYQVVLSYFKATWPMYTQHLGVTPRPGADPFTPHQSILFDVGNGMVLARGRSVSRDTTKYQAFTRLGVP